MYRRESVTHTSAVWWFGRGFCPCVCLSEHQLTISAKKRRLSKGEGISHTALIFFNGEASATVTGWLQSQWIGGWSRWNTCGDIDMSRKEDVRFWMDYLKQFWRLGGCPRNGEEVYWHWFPNIRVMCRAVVIRRGYSWRVKLWDGVYFNAEKQHNRCDVCFECVEPVVGCLVKVTNEFKVCLGLSQEFTLSPFLFATVMDRLTDEVRQDP